MEYLVDILMPAYNHELYIEDAMKGVVSQKTNFPFRLLIAEDFSSDNTKDIIEQYRIKYPDIIFPFYRTKNLGAYENSRLLFNEMKSKYIALCEGDDYWTDSTKLQKQVDFLENNLDFAICFHNTKIKYEEDPAKVTFSNPPNQAEVTTFEDLACGEYIYTPTCTFRLVDFKKFPREYYLHINNYTIDLHNAQYGKIKYINEVMSVYRKHSGGMWSMVAREKTIISQLPTYKFYVNYFDKKYKKYFLSHLKNMTAELISIKLGSKNFKNWWQHYRQYVFYNFRDVKEAKRMLNFFIRANYDTLTRLVKRK